MDLPLQKYLDKLAPFFGAFLVVVGLLFSYKGAELLPKLFGVMVFLIVSLVSFAIIYSLMLSDDV